MGRDPGAHAANPHVGSDRSGMNLVVQQVFKTCAVV